jgi:hypothetical protein
VTLETRPEVAPSSPEVKLRAHLEFEGNREYLPQFLADARPEDTNAPTVRYDYQASYSQGRVGGFFDDRQRVDVTAQGILQLTPNGKDPKTYTEQCVVTLKYPLTKLHPPTNSELRDRALRCVRDLFDQRLTHKGAAKETAQ